MIIAAIGVFSGKGKAMPSGNEMPMGQAIFMAINTATLTGFELPVPVRDYTPMGRMTVALMTASASAMFLIAGGWAVSRIARLRYSDRAILWMTVAAEGAAALIGVLALPSDGHEGVHGIFTRAARAFCAFGNSGLQFGSAPSVNHLTTHMVLLPLAVLGGLGLPVLMDIGTFVIAARKPSNHTRSVLTTTAAIYLVGLLALLVLQLLHANDGVVRGYTKSVTWVDPTQMVLGASAMTLNARTLGMPLSLPLQFGDAAAALQCILIPLMIIGASSGGTGGGA